MENNENFKQLTVPTELIENSRLVVPKPYDEVVLAEQTPFEINIQRYADPVGGDALVLALSAMIEEILSLKKRVAELELKASEGKDNEAE